MTTIKQPEWWEEWTYIDDSDYRVKLKDDAPESVKKEWDEIEHSLDITDEYED